MLRYEDPVKGLHLGGIIKMKYKGKVVSGSSLLTILGVVCFATVLVSAIVLSNTLNVNRTAHAGVTIGTTNDIVAFNPAANNQADLPASDVFTTIEYDFAVPVASTAEITTMVFTITGTGITSSSSVSMWNYVSTAFVIMTFTGYTTVPNTLTFTSSIPVHASPTDYGFAIMYNNIGAFNMAITLQTP